MLLSIGRDGVRGCFCQEDCISCSTLCCRGVRPTLHGTVDPKLPTETEVLEEATHDYERKSDENVERDLVLSVLVWREDNRFLWQAIARLEIDRVLKRGIDGSECQLCHRSGDKYESAQIELAHQDKYAPDRWVTQNIHTG